MTTDIQPAAIIVQQGKILDFIDGVSQRAETPEEYVRQEIAKSLVREYRYHKIDIEVEFMLRVGSRKPRADLLIFPPGTAHKQENAWVILECKNQSVRSSDKKKVSGNSRATCQLLSTAPTGCGPTALSAFVTGEWRKTAGMHLKRFPISLLLDKVKKTLNVQHSIG